MADSVATHTGTLSLLSRLSKTVYRRTTDDLLGMKLRHFLVISYLAEHDRVPQQYLQDVMHMDANNLVLADSGLAAFNKAEKARESVEDEVLQALDADERETLRRLLAKALGA